ncbi:MAG: hypothetical protein COA69_06470 [Robiginitomaculum sp.]|nr:MAG: hypothetical protein COA69_06470 [Robiginitomaculum sp.]
MKQKIGIIIGVMSLLCATSAFAGPKQAPEQTHEDHHEGFSESVKAFHDVMSKDWHAKTGPERMQSTCTNVHEYAQKAKAVVEASSPASVPATEWQTATTALVATVKVLEATCEQNDTADFQANFSSVHDKFHDLVKLLEASK